MTPQPPPPRRAFLEACTAAGLGGTLLPGVLWARVAGGAEITRETVRAAAEVAGLEFDEAEQELLLERLRDQTKSLAALRAVPLSNAVAPAVGFAVPYRGPAAPRRRPVLGPRRVELPGTPEDLAFLPAAALGELLRRREVSSVELTTLYLERLGRLDSQLKCVITLTPERARRQAEAADRELAAGRPRGPLHGVPWGAKDLLAVKGYRTTWGAGPYREQVLDEDATVVQRLDAAGCVLVAKLTLGELAQGDTWFGGMTRNPWKPDQGSSGSSAGSAAATAAGLVGFALGSETLGSISSPATRCGVTGLRPTFGRVPRTGAMALSWSMDKLGPLARDVEDCALVLDAIHGPDGGDDATQAAPFRWDGTRALRGIRVGAFMEAFDLPERDPADGTRLLHETRPFDSAALEVLRTLGLDPRPLPIPAFPYDALRLILTAEASAAFDDLTRSNRDAELVQQGRFNWPNTFRLGRFISAVDYLNANRIRRLVAAEWNRLFEQVDVIVTPTNYVGTSQLIATNLTGHPAVVVPNGFRATDGTPVSLTFLGRHYDEATLLRVAMAYQGATPFAGKKPPMADR